MRWLHRIKDCVKLESILYVCQNCSFQELISSLFSKYLPVAVMSFYCLFHLMLLLAVNQTRKRSSRWHTARRIWANNFSYLTSESLSIVLQFFSHVSSNGHGPLLLEFMPVQMYKQQFLTATCMTKWHVGNSKNYRREEKCKSAPLYCVVSVDKHWQW